MATRSHVVHALEVIAAHEKEVAERSAPPTPPSPPTVPPPCAPAMSDPLAVADAMQIAADGIRNATRMRLETAALKKENFHLKHELKSLRARVSELETMLYSLTSY